MTVPSMQAPEAEAMIRDFLASWRVHDLDKLMSFFSPDAVYHNVPVAPLRGAAAIRATFAAFLEAFEEASLDVVTLAAGPDLVLAERIDRFLMRDGRRVELPVTGVFQIADRRIVRFSDYFDLADFVRQSGIKL